MNPGRRVQIVICGLGGQGVVFLSRVLAQAAMLEGADVITAETHGMAQRGGAVLSFVKLGGFRGSVVRPGRADAVLVLDASRLEAGLHYAGDARQCVVNSTRAANGALACDATGIAVELGTPRATNLCLLGFACAERPDFFPGEGALLKAVELLSPPAVRSANVAALRRGIGAPA